MKSINYNQMIWNKVFGSTVFRAAFIGLLIFLGNNTLNSAQSATQCNGVESQLSSGTQARVVSDSGYIVNLRTEASLDADIVDKVSSDAQITIIGDPVCVEGIYFWRVSVAGKLGWIAETLEDGTVLLEPIPTTVEATGSSRSCFVYNESEIANCPEGTTPLRITLPSTGETPWWRKWVLGLIGIAGGVALTLILHLMHRLIFVRIPGRSR